MHTTQLTADGVSMGSGTAALSVVVLVYKSALERLKQQQNMEETIVQD